jgi:hypothetical protein
MRYPPSGWLLSQLLTPSTSPTSPRRQLCQQIVGGVNRHGVRRWKSEGVFWQRTTAHVALSRRPESFDKKIDDKKIGENSEIRSNSRQRAKPTLHPLHFFVINFFVKTLGGHLPTVPPDAIGNGKAPELLGTGISVRFGPHPQCTPLLY